MTFHAKTTSLRHLTATLTLLLNALEALWYDYLGGVTVTGQELTKTSSAYLKLISSHDRTALKIKQPKRVVFVTNTLAQAPSCSLSAP
jgi:hypothetical protein